MKDVNEVTGEIVDAAFRIHVRLGPGLLESVYEVVLGKMLEQRGLLVRRQAPIAFEYEGVRIDEAFRVDLLVDECVVVELKSVERLAPVHKKQVLTYLRLMNLDVGLLINFGSPTAKEGIHRIVNSYAGVRPGSRAPSASPRLRVSPAVRRP